MRCLTMLNGALSVLPEGAPCAPGDLVVLTQAEASQWQNVPWNLSIEQGQEIGVAVLVLWAVAFGIRQLIRLVASRHDFTEAEQ